VLRHAVKSRPPAGGHCTFGLYGSIDWAAPAVENLDLLLRAQRRSAGAMLRRARRIQLALTIADNHALSRCRNHARSAQRIAGPRINKTGGVAL
jgi:hypothetical protein